MQVQDTVDTTKLTANQAASLAAQLEPVAENSKVCALHLEQWIATLSAVEVESRCVDAYELSRMVPEARAMLLDFIPPDVIRELWVKGGEDFVRTKMPGRVWTVMQAACR